VVPLFFTQPYAACTHCFCNGKKTARTYLPLSENVFLPTAAPSVRELRGELGDFCLLPRTLRQLSEDIRLLLFLFIAFSIYDKYYR